MKIVMKMYSFEEKKSLEIMINFLDPMAYIIVNLKTYYTLEAALRFLFSTLTGEFHWQNDVVAFSQSLTKEI